MFFTNLFGLNEKYINDLGDEAYLLEKELSVETDKIRKKNLYREIVKINNTRIIYRYERIFPNLLKLILMFVKDEYGENNTFFDLLTNNIDYELQEDDKECLLYAVYWYNHWYKIEMDRFRDLCKVFAKGLRRIENKYMKDVI